MAKKMSARVRRFWWAAAIVMGTAGGFSLSYLIVINTDAGRGWLLSTLVARANGIFKGRGTLRIGVLRAISPGRVVAEKVSLVDTAGVPVIYAERVEGTLNVRGLFSRAIHIRTLTVQGLRLDLRQDTVGPWNISYLISGDTIKKLKTGPGFGDDVRIDSLLVNGGRVTMVGPWAPHPMFTGAARDSVIAVRKTLHDIIPGPAGVYFQRRVVSLDRVRAHEAVIVDIQKRPASMFVDSFSGEVSDPPVRIAHANGLLRWTSDSLQIRLPDVRLPNSRASAIGVVAWNTPGPVRYDVLVQADAGLSDLGWIWDVLPERGRGQATVRMHTLADANDAEYTLTKLDVSSGSSRIRGAISVIVRPAELLLRAVDLDFAPMQSDLMRRISYEALPPEIDGTFTGRLVAKAGGPLTAFKMDLLDARFADARADNARSSARLSGTVSLGARPRAWGVVIAEARADLRSVRLLAPALPAVDGIVTASGTIRSADLERADVADFGLVWTDAAGNVSRVRGDARVRYGTGTPRVQTSLDFDPLSLKALARLDTTFTMRSTLGGHVDATGSLEALQWSARVFAMGEGLAENRVALSGTAAVVDSQWRATAEGSLAGVDVRAWLGRSDVPATTLNGDVRVYASGTRPLAPDATFVSLVEGGGDIAISQSMADDRPGFDLIASASLDRDRLVLDSATARLGGVTFEGRGALARDSMRVDTLALSARADSLSLVRGQLERLAAMMQPLDSAIATSLRALGADTLRGDLSLSGFLYGSFRDADATLAIGARDMQVGAIRAGRIFGSARAQDVFTRPTFEGAATADEVEGIGAIRVQSAEFRVQQANPDSGMLVLDVTSQDDARLAIRGVYGRTAEQFVIRMDSVLLRYADVRWTNVNAVQVQQDSLALRILPFELRSTQDGVLALSADVPVNGPVRGDLRLDRFPVGEVATLVAGTAHVDGTITGTSSLRGTRQLPLLAWQLQGDSLGANGIFLPTMRSDGTYADRRLVARTIIDDSTGGVLRAEARVPLNLTIGAVEKRLLSETIDGEIVADSLRLDALGLGFDGVSRLRGIVGGRITVAGTIDRPIASGTMQASGLGAYLNDYGVEPVGGRLSLRASADSLVLESFRIQSGSAADTIGASGVLRFVAGEATSVALRIGASNFRAARQNDGTDLDVSGNVALNGPLKRPTLSGSVFIPMANIVIDPLGAREALDLSSDAARALLGADEVPVAETAVQSFAALGGAIAVDNARVDLGNNVWVQTPEARVKLSGGLNITTSGELLALEGEVTANRGQYRLDLGVVSRSFSVDSGRVRFFGNDAIEPTLDINATNVVRVAGGTEVPVRVNIGGTFLKPVLTLSSTDPLYASAPESEIISLLIFGAPTFALDGQSQSTVRAVTGVLLPTVGGFAEGALQRLLPGLNTVQVTTAGGQSQQELSALGLLDNLAISGGKQLGDRTFLRLNTGICRSTAGQSAQRGASVWWGVVAEYRIARGLTGQVGVDPGSAPCSRLGNDPLPRLQFGFDIFREWIF